MQFTQIGTDRYNTGPLVALWKKYNSTLLSNNGMAWEQHRNLAMWLQIQDVLPEIMWYLFIQLAEDLLVVAQTKEEKHYCHNILAIVRAERSLLAEKRKL